jgi:SpoVK/Ycf46/Vps4 family AAA+-type ATPase
VNTGAQSHPTEICQSIKLGIKSHIHLPLPNASTRRELFALHIPNPDRVTADYAVLAVLADLSRGLSSGDILNVCVNSIYAGSTDPNPERWLVTQALLEAEIKKVKKSKNRRRIGFQPG